MKRQMISALAVVALFAAATAMLRSPSIKLSAGTAAMPSLQNRPLPSDDLRVALEGGR